MKKLPYYGYAEVAELAIEIRKFLPPSWTAVHNDRSGSGYVEIDTEDPNNSKIEGSVLMPILNEIKDLNFHLSICFNRINIYITP